MNLKELQDALKKLKEPFESSISQCRQFIIKLEFSINPPPLLPDYYSLEYYQGLYIWYQRSINKLLVYIKSITSSQKPESTIFQNPESTIITLKSYLAEMQFVLEQAKTLTDEYLQNTSGKIFEEILVKIDKLVSSDNDFEPYTQDQIRQRNYLGQPLEYYDYLRRYYTWLLKRLNQDFPNHFSLKNFREILAELKANFLEISKVLPYQVMLDTAPIYKTSDAVWLVTGDTGEINKDQTLLAKIMLEKIKNFGLQDTEAFLILMGDGKYPYGFRKPSSTKFLELIYEHYSTALFVLGNHEYNWGHLGAPLDKPKSLQRDVSLQGEERANNVTRQSYVGNNPLQLYQLINGETLDLKFLKQSGVAAFIPHRFYAVVNEQMHYIKIFIDSNTLLRDYIKFRENASSVAAQNNQIKWLLSLILGFKNYTRVLFSHHTIKKQDKPDLPRDYITPELKGALENLGFKPTTSNYDYTLYEFFKYLKINYIHLPGIKSLFHLVVAGHVHNICLEERDNDEIWQFHLTVGSGAKRTHLNLRNTSDRQIGYSDNGYATLQFKPTNLQNEPYIEVGLHPLHDKMFSFTLKVHPYVSIQNFLLQNSLPKIEPSPHHKFNDSIIFACKQYIRDHRDSTNKDFEVASKLKKEADFSIRWQLLINLPDNYFWSPSASSLITKVTDQLMKTFPEDMKEITISDLKKKLPLMLDKLNSKYQLITENKNNNSLQN